ncbi:MAG TPA: hypothetical protein PLX23_04890 [Candidatus Hydrogenedens sp.]|nr:hypothetical protein [Candidatus Hydrogenedens sp.]
MNQSSVDRIKAEISTSEIKATWSVITGNLDSLVYLPENFEWIGKSEFNVHSYSRDKDNIYDEIIDLDFSEFSDEKSYGIQQIIYWTHSRLKLNYYALLGVPSIFLKGERLVNTSNTNDLKSTYFRINLDKKIDKVKFDLLSSQNNNEYDLAYIETYTGIGLLFYAMNGIEMSIKDIESNGCLSINIGTHHEAKMGSDNLLQLSRVYICPYKIVKVNDFLSLHSHLLDSLGKYEKWVKDKEKE